MQTKGTDWLDEGLCKVSEAAKLLNVSRSKLYLMMGGGEVEYVKLGKSRRIPRQAIHDLVQRNLVTRG